MVNACPKCGRLILLHCYHDGYETPSVLMEEGDEPYDL